ncbi:nitronate monooxygenase [Variovorax sp. dw_954]|uniref:NAD(P)H-dependent flavin oxidoreductase n=1 Tax=Variovorax sp. dw_954 TaxID=2720078 RepID=UPI001BD37A2B|nr:nitronate monooxygenase [Variovorax sp. dw_954]
MPLPTLFQNTLSVPVIGAPMFLVSFPPLVTALCKAGVVGTFPHVNARPTAQLDDWLSEIERELASSRAADPKALIAPFGINLVVHHTNPRFEPDLEVVVAHKVPFVITCLGNPAPVVQAVHAYGGTVFCDVTSAEHARKSARAGVDGLICVGAGAGGHASSQGAFSLVREIREFWQGSLVLGGAINDGWQVRAAEMLGADLAYMGTRFLATRESQAQQAYKQMVVDAGVADLIYTDRFSGVPANFLRASIDRFGIDVATLPPKKPDMASLTDTEARVWKDLWSAGQGVATIHDIPTVAELVRRIAEEYRAACRIPPSPALRTA